MSFRLRYSYEDYLVGIRQFAANIGLGLFMVP